jgi:glycosyltransferase involved in cell wall biosynthesis
MTTQAAAPPALSIVIPAFNEVDRLPGTLQAMDAWAAGWSGRPVEVVVVDDGSSDGTAEAAEAWAKAAEHVAAARVLRAGHRGKGAAVARGMCDATGAVRLFMDADLAVPLSYVDAVAQALDSGADVAIGSRELDGAVRSGEPFYRHVMGRAYNRVVGALAVRGIPDTQCGFKGFSAEATHTVFSRVRLYPPDAPEVTKSRVTGFDVELLAVAQRQQLRIVQIPVEWRHVERSKVRPLADAINMLWDALRVRLNTWLGRYD